MKSRFKIVTHLLRPKDFTGIFGHFVLISLRYSKHKQTLGSMEASDDATLTTGLHILPKFLSYLRATANASSLHAAGNASEEQRSAESIDLRVNTECTLSRCTQKPDLSGFKWDL